MAAPQRTVADVELLPMTEADLYEFAAGNLEAFPTFYAPLEHLNQYPSEDVRIQRQAKRLVNVINSEHTMAVKAVLAAGPDQGKLVGVTLWFRPSATKVLNLKRYDWEGRETDEEAWSGVDVEKWNAKWAGWDSIRERIMDGYPHWYLAPLWVKPEYQGQGVGKKLLQQVLDLADSTTPTTPIFLEASAAGRPMYEKIGFTIEGDEASEYPELVRWHADGRKRDR
ncbi:hypothetical protein JCM8097_003704 [Rhodosporidiobolus ruineniae]